MRTRWLIGIGAGVVGLGLVLCLTERPPVIDPEAPVAATEAPVEAWVAERAAEALKSGVRPGNEPRLVRNTAGEAPLAVLYIHGFGASRAEGEAVIDPLAASLGANVLYLLLPGHGTDDPDVHARPQASDYLKVVTEGLVEVQQLGERILVVGSSTGGLLATWLAARHPDQVDALILASPFFAFADPAARLLADSRVGPSLVPLVLGPDRYAGWKHNPEGRVQQPGYDQHWTTHQRTAALFTLADLRRALSTPEVLRRVRAPALVFYYDKDPEHTDGVVDIGAMKEAFGAFGGEAGPNPRSRMVNIEDGNHILMSAHVRTDKDRINSEIRSFLAETGLGPTP